MESTTMTNATQISRVRVSCPLADRSLVNVVRAGGAGAWGTGVSAFGFGGTGVFGTDRSIALSSTVYVPTHKPSIEDVAPFRTGEPPV